MKKITFIALSALPVLGLVSCGEKEAPAAPATTETAAPAETPAPAAKEKALVTAEDYMIAMIETMEQLADTFEATTPENSAEQAKKIAAIAAKMNKLEEEVQEKGLDKNSEPSPEMKARMEEAASRIVAWMMANVDKLEQMHPDFLEVMQNMGQ